MTIWSSEIKDLEILNESIVGKLPLLEKELEQLIKTQDANVAMLYSRRCLEVIVTDLCEFELKRPRKTEPMKGIIDKLNSEEKVPSHIITSMIGLNSLSTYGAHPKDFDPEQVKPALNNLTIVIKWYLKYRESRIDETHKPDRSKSELSVDKGIKTESRKYKIKQKNILITIALVVLSAAAITIIYFAVKGGGRYANLEKSIAVLPFRNDSHDDSTQYFMDGVMEELLTNLQKIKELRVLGRTSSEQYRDQNKSIPQIAKELGVNYIIEGSGQKSGNSLRMRVQLIRVNKESHIWANNFEQENLNLKDYFRIQASFAEAIAKELNAVITPDEKQLMEKVSTERLEAYEAYLQGVFYWRKLSENDLEAAMKYFELAKEKDPDFALAYAGIGYIWLARQQMGYVSPEVAGPEAVNAITKAQELDSDNADVQFTIACMKTWGMWDWEGGEAAFKRTLELNPNHSEAHANYSHLLNIMGRAKEAMEQIEIALKIDPLNILVKGFYCIDLFFVRQYDDAIKTSLETLKMDPTNQIALATLAWSYHKTEKFNEALESWKSVLSTTYKDAVHVFDQGYAKGGYTGALSLEADTLTAQLKDIYVMPIDIAMLYASAGNKEKAIEFLENGYEIRDPTLPYLLMPVWDSLRDEPGFQYLARKMNLPYK